MTALVSRRAQMSIWAVVVVAAVAGPAGQTRTPATTEDAEFARLVKEWTTRPDFSSPLVSHLPRRQGVPTPKDVLGYYIGEPKRLTYTASQQAYFKALEKALPGAGAHHLGRAVRGRTRHPGGLHLVGGQPQEPRDQPAEPPPAGRSPRPVTGRGRVAGRRHQAALPHLGRPPQRRDLAARGGDRTGLPAGGVGGAVHPQDSRQPDRRR